MLFPLKVNEANKAKVKDCFCSHILLPPEVIVNSLIIHNVTHLEQKKDFSCEIIAENSDLQVNL